MIRLPFGKLTLCNGTSAFFIGESMVNPSFFIYRWSIQTARWLEALEVFEQLQSGRGPSRPGPDQKFSTDLNLKRKNEDLIFLGCLEVASNYSYPPRSPFAESKLICLGTKLLDSCQILAWLDVFSFHKDLHVLALIDITWNGDEIVANSWWKVMGSCQLNGVL